MPDLTDEALHAQLREWADDLAGDVPAWSPAVGAPTGQARRRWPRRRAVVALVAVACVVAGAVAVVTNRSASRSGSVLSAQGPDTAGSGERRYRATGPLTTAPDGSVRLCPASGYLADVLRDPSSTVPTPPSCTEVSIPVEGIDVTALPDVHTVGRQTFTASGVTVTGTWDGTSLTATGPVSPPVSPVPAQPSYDFSVPCPTPRAGWPPMPSTLAAYTTALGNLRAYETAHPDTFAGAWAGPDQETMVEAFTDDPANHESELTAIYRRVCVFQGTRTMASLVSLGTDLTAGKMPDGNRALTTGIVLAQDRSAGPFALLVTLLVDDPDVRAWLKAQYGSAVVVQGSVLAPA